MLKLHYMGITPEDRKVFVGKVIEVDPLQIESVKPVDIWNFDECLSDEERKKIDPERLASTGNLIKMHTGTYCVVMESKNYIDKAV